MRISQYMNESLDKAVPYRWKYIDDEQSEAVFTIDGNEYSVSFDPLNDKEGKKQFYLTFDMSNNSERSQFGITGTGNEFKVFATVAAIVKEFVKTIPSKLIVFSAKESSRRRLYDMFAKLFVKEGWKPLSDWEIQNHGSIPDSTSKTYAYKKRK